LEGVNGAAEEEGLGQGQQSGGYYGEGAESHAPRVPHHVGD
jgi:hypothetical protein